MPSRKNFPLRISPELYAALERWAADEMRSVNGQIEFLLSQSVKQAGRLRDKAEKAEADGGDTEKKAKAKEEGGA